MTLTPLVAALLEHVAQAVLISDAHGRVRGANAALLELVGKSNDDLVGSPTSAVISAAGIRSPGGAYIPVAVHRSNVAGPDGQLQAVVLSVTAVGESGDVKRALLDPRVRLRTLFPRRIFLIHDLQGIVRDVNDFGCRRLGYTRNELMVASVDAIDVDGVAAQWRLLQPGTSVISRGRLHRKDGSTVPVELTLTRRSGARRRSSCGRRVTSRTRSTTWPSSGALSRASSARRRMSGRVCRESCTTHWANC